jgi:uncharacterized protein
LSGRISILIKRVTVIQSLDFRPIELIDREWMEPLLRAEGRDSLEYSFTSNFLWQKVYGLRVAQYEGYLVQIAGGDEHDYLFPAGNGPLDRVIRALRDDARERGGSLLFHTILGKHKQKLEEMFPGRFIFESQRDAFDYVYTAESLITLKGKKLSSKRNHINAFKMSHASWQYEPLNRDNLGDAQKMSDEWCKEAGCKDSTSLSSETCAVDQAFRYYFDLGLEGGLLRTDGRVVAFTMGDPLNDDTYLVHFEKAFADVRGAYPMINQLFAQHNCAGYTYINREDDANDPGLRQAKLSYDPAFMVAKYTARLTGDEPI